MRRHVFGFPATSAQLFAQQFQQFLRTPLMAGRKFSSSWPARFRHWLLMGVAVAAKYGSLWRWCRRG